MKTLIIATHNPGKLEEMGDLLGDCKVELVDMRALDSMPSVEETGRDYTENAVLKTRAVADFYEMWALGDDTGLEVEALDGAPGLRSARLAGSDAARREKLIEMLKGHARPWKATFVSVIALCSPEGEIHVAEGRCEGEIIPEGRGEMGFGYDPLFLIDGTDRTMAELPMSEKNKVSHRARAIVKLKPILRRRMGI